MNSFAELDETEKDLRDLPNQNGRVTFGPSFGSEGISSSIPGYGHETTVETNFIYDMLRGNWEQNTLSRAFFSPDNIKVIQHNIRKGVYDQSGDKKYIIEDQSVDELKIILRGIFYQYARNLETDIKGQVADLNQKVVDWSVPHVLSAVDHYHYYINDISHMPVPMQQPQNISRAGTRSLPLNPYM